VTAGPPVAEAKLGTPAAPLRPIKGPSAFGGSPRRFASLLWMQSVTEFKAGYLHTSFGYLWSLARPLMLFGVLLVVFTKVFRIGSDVPNYPVMLLFNIMLFTFFQEATTNAVQSVVDQENIVRKMQFPRIVIPLSIVLTAAFNLCLNMIAVFVFILAYGVDPSWTWLGLPLILGALVVFTTGVSMLLSALYVRFRDVAIIWSVFVQILFYASPILYPIEILPPDSEVQSLIQLNPLTPLFELARVWIIDTSQATADITAEAIGSAVFVAIPIALFAAICALGYWVFTREAPRIAEEL
jgi:ABC-2 type transport system permease protein